jgi:hypothetical protein
MHRVLGVALCFLGVLAGAAQAQTFTIEPVHIAAGAILDFHLQTRLNPGDGNALDELPKGTILRVKMLEPIDSNVKQDGSEFHGVTVSSLESGGEVVIHSEAEVDGIFVLLRSRSHPDGFRYELLVTGLKDHGKYYALTASLSSSVTDGGSQPVATSKAHTREDSKEPASKFAVKPAL